MRNLEIPLAVPIAGFLLAATLLAALTLGNLSHPLMWHDEASTAMFGRRVLDYGYPKVHGPKNIVYGLEAPLSVGVNEELDAYLGSPWGQYYFAALAERFARGADDLYEKTGRLRLPFALAGLLGLGALLLGLLPAVGGSASRRWAFALLFVLLCCYSISLLLHLREVRYYALVVLLSGALLHLFLRRHCYERIGAGLYAVSLVPLLFALFNVFYPAFGVFVAAAFLHHLGRAARSGAADRTRRLLIDVIPLAIACLAVAPLIVFYELFDVTGALLGRYDAARGYGARLTDAAATLLRYEFLAPALLARLLVLGLRLARRGERLPQPLARRLAASDSLMLFSVVYILLVSRTPFFYERYFIALSPVLSAVLLLDAFSLPALAHGAARGVRRAGIWGLAGLIVAVGVVAAVRLPELRGRFHEIRQVYRGPLDHVIPHLLEHYDAPGDLVVATNYEGPAFMYYLECRVLVGFYTPHLRRDLLFRPDVVVPRAWGKGFSALGWLSAKDDWDQTSFPVEPLKANNVPSLSPRNQARLVHRFRSPDLPDGQAGFNILERSARE